MFPNLKQTRRHFNPLFDSPCFIVNKFEWVPEALCTVRSKLIKFENVGRSDRPGPVQGGCGPVQEPPLTDRQTDLTQNITFPQLRWQAVKKLYRRYYLMKNVTVRIVSAREQFHAPESDFRREIQPEVRLYTLTYSAGITAAPSFQNSSKDEMIMTFSFE